MSRAKHAAPQAMYPKPGSDDDTPFAPSPSSQDLSEFEYGLIILMYGFQRWVQSCMDAANVHGLNALDIPMARHGYRFWEKRQLLWKNLSATLGLGAGNYLTLFIPFVNLALIPLAAVGATLVYLRIRKGDGATGGRGDGAK